MDVRYTYEEIQKRDEEKIVRKVITHTDLANLPTDWIDLFRELTMKGRSGELLNLVETIRDIHGQVADVLAEMVRNFQFTQIIALIEKGEQV